MDSNKTLRQFLRKMDMNQPAQQIAEKLHQKLLKENTERVDDDQTLLLFKI